MVEENRKEISFGKGGNGEIKREYDMGKDKDGEDIVKFVFIPFKNYVSIYDPKSDEFTNIKGYDLLKVIVKKKYIIRENTSPETESVKILCGPRGEETEYTKLHDKLFFELTTKSSYILLLRKEIARLKKELEKATSPQSYKEERKAEIYSAVREAVYDLGIKK